MKLDLTGIHIEITDAIREFVERKTEKLSKFFKDEPICHVTISTEKDRKHVDIRIEYKSRTYLAEENGEDIYHGIEKSVEKIEGQVRKVKTKLEKKRREGLTEDQLDKLTLEEL